MISKFYQMHTHLCFMAMTYRQFYVTLCSFFLFYLATGRTPLLSYFLNDLQMADHLQYHRLVHRVLKKTSKGQIEQGGAIANASVGLQRSVISAICPPWSQGDWYSSL